MNGLINSYCISSVCTQTMDAGNWCGSQCSKKRNDALSAPSNGPRFFSGSMPLAAPRRSARTDESTSTWRRPAARFPGEVSASPDMGWRQVGRRKPSGGCSARTGKRPGTGEGRGVEEEDTPIKAAGAGRGDECPTSYFGYHLKATSGSASTAVRHLIAEVDAPFFLKKNRV